MEEGLGFAITLTTYFEISVSYQLPHTKKVKQNRKNGEKGFAKTVSRARSLPSTIKSHFSSYSQNFFIPLFGFTVILNTFLPRNFSEGIMKHFGLSDMSIDLKQTHTTN